MTDYLNKLVSVIIIFLMLVVAPLLMSYMTTEMVTERVALNEVSQFIDRVTDKQMITKSDVDDLYIALGASGGIYNVEVKRYVVVSVPTKDASGATTVKNVYVAADDISNISEDKPITLNLSDVVQVRVKEVSLSQAKRLLYAVLRVDEGKLDFTLAGSVR